MDIQGLLNIAARDLPEGWVIEIYVEQGSAGVRLEDPDGDGMQCDFVGLDIEEQVKVAIKTAQGQNYRWPKKEEPREVKMDV